MRATAGWLGQVLAWLVILGVVGVLAVAVAVPRIAGATPYTVLTGSMAPSYPPGTLVVVKPVDFDQIGIGDVVTYQIESGKPAVATHRVVGEANRFDGTRVLITQGDANGDPDPLPVTAVQVRGELWYSVPYLGHVNTALSGSQRQLAVWVVAGLLVGYAAYMFVGSVRDRRRSRRGEPDAVPGTDAAAPPVPVVVPAPEAPTGPTGVPALLVGVAGVTGWLLLTDLARRRTRTT